MARRPFTARADRPAPRPLDGAALEQLALHYVGRFATSEARLGRYLARKIFERGWNDAGLSSDAVAATVAKCARLGFVNDAAFAHQRGGALGRRGLGERRLRAQLSVDGIASDIAAPVLDAARDDRLATALAFARRRRLGPYGSGIPSDPKARDKILAAFLRAGHDPATARRILAVAPGDDAALAELDAGQDAG
ncbi:MAG: RecX family transcriptional regulator [Sphingopyxis sp.]|nr:RecX family transcriptional regulator [Sphingopyxis sp.]